LDQLSFVFTIFFMLLGPIKLIPVFAGLTRGADIRFQRSVAFLGTMIALALCAFVVLAGEVLLKKYRISIDAVRISGGIVLLISALQVIFQKAHHASPDSGARTAIQVAASPIATPTIVPPAGVAAILLCILCEPQYPGIVLAVVISIAIIMALDFLVMRFIDQAMKTPGLMIMLTVLGSVLVFVQASLAIQMILVALKSLRVIQA
jgi:multiple antibiotic resistance protein